MCLAIHSRISPLEIQQWADSLHREHSNWKGRASWRDRQGWGREVAGWGWDRCPLRASGSAFRCTNQKVWGKGGVREDHIRDRASLHEDTGVILDSPTRAQEGRLCSQQAKVECLNKKIGYSCGEQRELSQPTPAVSSWWSYKQEEDYFINQGQAS